MDEKNIRKLIGKTMMDIAESIETSDFKKKIRIGITTLGSEHGIENIVKGAEKAARENRDMEVVLIGPKVDTELEIAEASTEEKVHYVMGELLNKKLISACVTMHYDFPIGVSTVGKVITPAKGKEMFLATTTGTSSVNRSEAMVKNTLHGIIAAKAMGIENPEVGILNLDGARQVERALKTLSNNGYPIKFSESMRLDGGAVMRGNDLLCGTADVMVTDTLTGNIMMKMFSSFNTGGSYEAVGYGYGPGIGKGYDKTVLILSRASGVPVVANALVYAKSLVRGNLICIGHEEYEKAEQAGLKEILLSFHEEVRVEESKTTSMPVKETVTAQISGIDIMDLDDAVKVLWSEDIYAESGMGCTGPIIRINEKNLNKAKSVLETARYL